MGGSREGGRIGRVGGSGGWEDREGGRMRGWEDREGGRIGRVGGSGGWEDREGGRIRRVGGSGGWEQALITGQLEVASSPGPHPTNRGERGLVSLAKIPICAESAYYATHPNNHIPTSWTRCICHMQVL